MKHTEAWHYLDQETIPFLGLICQGVGGLNSSHSPFLFEYVHI